MQQSEREKVRATHQIEGETWRVDGEDRWTSARVSQQQQKQESTLFPLIPGDLPFPLSSLGVPSMG